MPGHPEATIRKIEAVREAAGNIDDPDLGEIFPEHRARVIEQRAKREIDSDEVERRHVHGNELGIGADASAEVFQIQRPEGLEDGTRDSSEDDEREASEHVEDAAMVGQQGRNLPLLPSQDSLHRRFLKNVEATSERSDPSHGGSELLRKIVV